jgi:hypothetical protein
MLLPAREHLDGQHERFCHEETEAYWDSTEAKSTICTESMTSLQVNSVLAFSVAGSYLFELTMQGSSNVWLFKCMEHHFALTRSDQKLCLTTLEVRVWILKPIFGLQIACNHVHLQECVFNLSDTSCLPNVTPKYSDGLMIRKTEVGI